MPVLWVGQPVPPAGVCVCLSPHIPPPAFFFLTHTQPQPSPHAIITRWTTSCFRINFDLGQFAPECLVTGSDGTPNRQALMPWHVIALCQSSSGRSIVGWDKEMPGSVTGSVFLLAELQSAQLVVTLELRLAIFYHLMKKKLM